MLNLAHWSTEYAQKMNYPLFKDFFMHTAAFVYAKTKLYPISRTDVAEAVHSEYEIKPILDVVNNISNASKQKQFEAFEVGLGYIQSMLQNP
jgi:hypothetical protein